ncbi:MAG: AAA family ATPase [Gemmatimonadetes bacterium]|nr:AAA family ATPase [Gemmatimonadota bacterium]
MAVFVGREKELQQLEERLGHAVQGNGGVVFVTGDAGAGKSTLIEQFLVGAALAAPEARVISAGCSEQYGAAEPYQPFVEAFRDLMSEGQGRGGKRSLKELAGKLAPFWVQAIPVAGDVIAATMATAQELKGSLGGATATATAPSEEALFFQYTELFLAAAEESPIILFIDDLHWADRASVSLLAHLARKIADKPVLILGTYRQADVEAEKHPLKQAKLELQRYDVAEEMVLEALDASALAEFVEGELGGPPTPELLNLLERRAGSNPLFFGELLRWLVEQGHVAERHGEWDVVHLLEEVEIPRSAESVIEKRLGRLDEELHRVLEYASVEGDEFDSTTLAALLDMDELDLEEGLDVAVRKHRLIRLAGTRDLPTGEPASVYQFGHSLIRDVLHSNLQGKRRILLHRKIAGILEETYADDLESIAHKLAIHYDEGRNAERACEFAMRAAEGASGMFAHWDAIELLRLALRNSETTDCKLRVQERLADETRAVGHYADALQEYHSAIKLADRDGDGDSTVRLKRKVALAERDFGNRPPQELRQELQTLAAQARDGAEPRELCEILWGLSSLPGTDRSAEREALEIAQGIGDVSLIARAHATLAQALAFRGDASAAVPHARQALELYEDQEDKIQLGRCHNILGIAHVLMGDYAEGVKEMESAATIFDEVGEPVNEAMVRNNIAPVLTQRGEWDRAEENLEESIRLCLRMDASARLLHPLENMARLSQARGDEEAARRGWTELLEKAQAIGYWDTEIVARCGLGTLDLEAGDLEAARDQLRVARELMPENGDSWPDYRQDLELFAARVAAAEGRREEALAILEEGEAELAEGDRYLWATYRLFHGELTREADPAAARPILEEALGVFERLGAEPMRRAAADLLTGTGGGW